MLTQRLLIRQELMNGLLKMLLRKPTGVKLKLREMLTMLIIIKKNVIELPLLRMPIELETKQ